MISSISSGTSLGFVLAALGAAVAGLITAFLQTRSLQRLKAQEPSFADRVEQAIQGLRSATMIVEDLENEISARLGAVERLQEQQELLKLDRAEVEAVSHLLQGDAKREGRRAVWISVAASAFFFLAGVGVTLLLGP
jgi:TolA-binding protein